MESRPTRFVIDRPEAPRRPRFALMPLIDIMFLLLIFFMLSSQISPYSLLPVGAVESQTRAPAGERAAGAALALVVSNGFVRIRGERVAAVQLRTLLEGFVAEGASDFVVIATEAASVQDIVSTLEALRAAAAGNVTLVTALGSEG